MSEDKLQKQVSEPLREKIQYGLAFGVIATMLLVAQFPMFIIIFFGIFAYFLWKTFASPSPNGTREVFEFYLSANEILRDDERRWFGFEVQDTIGRGERILQMMNGAPPLVYFTLGALYNKIGEHKSAVNHLAYILENETSDEKTYLYASPELKNYVRILRKIERDPAEAPQTSAAVRALERARRNRGKMILEESRKNFEEEKQKKLEISAEQKKEQLKETIESKKIPASVTANETEHEENERAKPQFAEPSAQEARDEKPHANGNGNKTKAKGNNFAHRQPISELLHDIYDEK
ncbi:MAG: hypothetical protein ACR2L1_03070 [Pyrinomonadaceae bacterium]